ncbi:MAG: bifunctional 5,10-methylene-tetrahydrofolate dehydrogenase/5,10-methylene-tetrahydrofolate cyclohydrolase [Ruminococcaceae bacterium]|nr:bifunctional 5,10-methylene-tetrahydrofolate dehydrogenase/5,10-methylene-tetrahydrofolate cyclohydrolase [Oscillospiraceae bacterium]
MAQLLSGKPVAEAMRLELTARCEALRERGILPTLAIVRVGQKPDDLAYERGAKKRAEQLGVQVHAFSLPEDASQEALLALIDRLNDDASVHGVLLLRPLPPHLQLDAIRNRLDPEKDVDGMCDLSAAAIYNGHGGFAPCTAEACIQILAHYGMECAGKHAVVLGRSTVIGKPVAMLLLQKNATVTICHSKSRQAAQLCTTADILVSATGRLCSVTKDFVHEGQTVIDVAINWDANRPNAAGGLGTIAGDADFDEIEPIVEAITPVPGGVGSVTTSILMRHTIEAAEKR